MANFTGEQLANARLIISVGLEMGMSQRDIMIGLMTAMQESSLRNLGGGDRDSAGLFQQRPSMGWGTYAQVTNPIYATRTFFRRLKGVKNRTNMSLWEAAQAVQRSADGTLYAKWENDARRLMNATGMRGGLPFPLNIPRADISLFGDQREAIAEATTKVGAVQAATEDEASPGAPGAGDTIGEIAAPTQPAPKIDLSGVEKEFASVNALAGGGAREIIVREAMNMLGTPYSWGGGGVGGPSTGFGRGAGIVGFDCSSLVQYAMAKAGIRMPRVTYDQVHMGQRAPISSLQPGDLVFGNVQDQGPGHVGIYIGNGQMIEAPYTGGHVRITKVRSDMFGVHLNIPGSTEPVTSANVGQEALDEALVGAAEQTAPTLENVPGIEASMGTGI